MRTCNISSLHSYNSHLIWLILVLKGFCWLPIKTRKQTVNCLPAKGDILSNSYYKLKPLPHPIDDIEKPWDMLKAIIWAS